MVVVRYGFLPASYCNKPQHSGMVVVKTNKAHQGDTRYWSSTALLSFIKPCAGF
jgi:hypothetical protein